MNDEWVIKRGDAYLTNYCGEACFCAMQSIANRYDDYDGVKLRAKRWAAEHGEPVRVVRLVHRLRDARMAVVEAAKAWIAELGDPAHVALFEAVENLEREEKRARRAGD